MLKENDDEQRGNKVGSYPRSRVHGKRKRRLDSVMTDQQAVDSALLQTARLYYTARFLNGFERNQGRANPSQTDVRPATKANRQKISF